MKRGRPRLKVVEGRVSMGFRVTPKLYDVIVTRAQKSGRSMSQEVEMMLEQAVLTEKLLSAIAYMTMTGKSANEIIEVERQAVIAEHNRALDRAQRARSKEASDAA